MAPRWHHVPARRLNQRSRRCDIPADIGLWTNAGRERWALSQCVPRHPWAVIVAHATQCVVGRNLSRLTYRLPGFHSTRFGGFRGWWKDDVRCVCAPCMDAGSDPSPTESLSASKLPSRCTRQYRGTLNLCCEATFVDWKLGMQARLPSLRQLAGVAERFRPNTDAVKGWL